MFLLKKALIKLTVRGTAISTKFSPSYNILFMADLKDEILREVKLELFIWWQYIDDISFGNMEKKN